MHIAPFLTTINYLRPLNMSENFWVFRFNMNSILQIIHCVLMTTIDQLENKVVY